MKRTCEFHPADGRIKELKYNQEVVSSLKNICVMKKILFATIVFISLAFIKDKPISNDCKCKNIPLYGRVKIVNIDPDFRVKIVTAFPDLKVKLVCSFPDRCGEWLIVESFPDFTIQLVDIGQDFTIQFVENFPGVK
jgi:hypothetical protein